MIPSPPLLWTSSGYIDEYINTNNSSTNEVDEVTDTFNLMIKDINDAQKYIVNMNVLDSNDNHSNEFKNQNFLFEKNTDDQFTKANVGLIDYSKGEVNNIDYYPQIFNFRLNNDYDDNDYEVNNKIDENFPNKSKSTIN